MTTIQLFATATVASLAAYLWIGVYAWRAAERRDFDGENWRLIYRWPGAALVAGVVLMFVLPAIYDTLGDTE